MLLKPSGKATAYVSDIEPLQDLSQEDTLTFLQHSFFAFVCLMFTFSVMGIDGLYVGILLVFIFGRLLGNLADILALTFFWEEKGQCNFLFKNLPLQKWQVKGGDPSSSSCLRAMFGSCSCFKE